MSEIRPTYSGLITVIITVFSVFTSLAFSIIITRNLSQTEFGLWGALGSLIVYGMILDPIVGYWITRETARNENSQKTAILFNQTLSFGGIIIFVIVIFLLGVNDNLDYEILLLLIFLIPTKYLLKILNTINFGWKPQNNSYGMFISEITKIIVGLVFIFHFQMGLAGLILTLLVSYLANIIVLSVLSREKLTYGIQLKYIKKWIKNSFISLYDRLKTIVYESDKILVAIMMDSVIAVSYFMAAMIVASLVTYSTSISQVVYGKLLSGSKTDFLKDTLSLHFFIALPLVSISIIFAEIGMRILNPIYEIASIVVIVLTIKSFFQSFRSAFSYYILGSEDVDKYSVNARKYIKSSLVYVPTLSLIQYLAYIVLLFLVLFLMKDELSDINVAVYWSVVSLIVTIPGTVYFWILAKKKTHLVFDLKRIIKFSIIALGVFGSTYFFIPDQFTETSSFELIFKLLPLILFSLGMYFGLIIIVDNKIRLLLKLIFNEINTLFNKSK